MTETIIPKPKCYGSFMREYKKCNTCNLVMDCYIRWKNVFDVPSKGMTCARV